jgi:uncharacterized membrane protein
MFWLSHHHADELDRTFHFGGVHVCARCLGTYPTLFAAFFAQFKLHAPLSHPLDIVFCSALFLPALADWAYGRFRPHAFSNAWRLLTGVALGLSLARSLFIHVQKPFPFVLLIQIGFVCVVAIPVFLATYRRVKT